MLPMTDDTVADFSAQEPSTEKTLFRDLPLGRELQLAIESSGYISPTSIQEEIIPLMLEGRDILAQSQTGTGKTAAFALPILSRLEAVGSKPQVLVLAPTRELATQVAESFERYGANMPGLKVLAIYGGAEYESQLRMLKRGVHIVVGTPGRIIDHIKRGTLKLDALRCLVLDEADEMLNMGFIEDVEFVLAQTPAEKQVALFSATLPTPIRQIADQYLKDPASITIRRKTLTADSIEQRCVFVDEREKPELLARLLEVESTDGVIVFTKTKDSTITVAERLADLGHSAAALNGDLPQARRQRTVDQLKSGKLDILVATDVAARGLDVQRISHVINYDLPHDSESYVHRIGRTGRAGRAGVAIIFLTHRQRGKLRLIENVTKKAIEVIEPPSATEINQARIRKFKDEILAASGHADADLYQKIIAQFAAESGRSVESIAAALAIIARGGRPLLAKDHPRPERPSRRAGKFAAATTEHRSPNGKRRSIREPESHMQRYWIGVGHSDGVQPGNIVGAIANESGISGSDIGPINIRGEYSTIDLPADLPPNVIQILQRTWVAGKQLRIRPFTDRKADFQNGSKAESGEFRKHKPKSMGRFKKPSGAFTPGGPPRGKSKKRRSFK